MKKAVLLCCNGNIKTTEIQFSKNCTNKLSKCINDEEYLNIFINNLLYSVYKKKNNTVNIIYKLNHSDYLFYFFALSKGSIVNKHQLPFDSNDEYYSDILVLKCSKKLLIDNIIDFNDNDYDNIYELYLNGELYSNSENESNLENNNDISESDSSRNNDYKLGENTTNIANLDELDSELEEEEYTYHQNLA
tara:strand:+ start:614 stop:1186 length:573 start_codon:yes stop_codon:yes gene_type:complete